MKFKQSLWPILFLIAGCGAPYGVKEVGEAVADRPLQSSAAGDGRLSEYSARYLRYYGLESTFEKNPRKVIDQILLNLVDTPSQPAKFVLAELCYFEGNRHPPASAEAGRCFLTSALFAYTFLFQGQNDAYAPADRRYFLAGQTYNHALSRALARHPLKSDDWAKGATLETLVGPIRIAEHSWSLPWSSTAIDRFESAFRYSVTGISDPARREGIGVPLIAIHSQQPANPASELDAFHQPIPTQALPATFCLRFQGSLSEALRNRGAGLTADVSILDPFAEESIGIGGHTVAIEGDVITPLAYSIQHAPKLSGFKGFLNTDSWGDRHGLFMAHPYQKGKIPVVFVYGLTGKPTTWTLMFNHLVSNETLRRRFQFWYFMYPTGNPVLYSAAELRGQLVKARTIFDPDGVDPAFNQMVIIGHSMGGLVTRLQVTDSGDQVWNAVMNRSFDSIEQDDARRDLVRSVFFFKSHPFVSRVVFMATPHRGSALADSRFARRFSGSVHLSNDVRLAGERIMHESTATTMASRDHAPTAVQSLSAENPVLLAVDQIPIPTRIKYHSLIANRDAAGVTGGTDSIVPYSSSHLEGAVSETIIHSRHGCTRNPDAIREVERILILHLAEIDAGKR